MPDQSVARQHHATFEGMRHGDEHGNEFWPAHPLAKVLDYSELLPHRWASASRGERITLGAAVMRLCDVADICN
jgi:hypothetical protein